VALALIVVSATVAAAIDVGARRVPNRLTGGIAAVGLLLAGLQVTGAGLAAALGGLCVGALLMLPGHLIGRTGAGDVKLLAALGTLLGKQFRTARHLSQHLQVLLDLASMPAQQGCQLRQRLGISPQRVLPGLRALLEGGSRSGLPPHPTRRGPEPGPLPQELVSGTLSPDCQPGHGFSRHSVLPHQMAPSVPGTVACHDLAGQDRLGG